MKFPKSQNHHAIIKVTHALQPNKNMIKDQTSCPPNQSLSIKGYSY